MEYYSAIKNEPAVTWVRLEKITLKENSCTRPHVTGFPPHEMSRTGKSTDTK